jgi:hypothetical protein
MNDSLFSTKDMVKYLIVAGLVYAILKMIPSVQLADKDLMLLLAIITVGFVCLDCLYLKKIEGFANDDPFTLDLNTDINELIKQRQTKMITRQESNSMGTRQVTSEESERQAILSRLEEKRQKYTNPEEITKSEIKKLDEQISNSSSSTTDVKNAILAKAELENRLSTIRSNQNITQEADKFTRPNSVRTTVSSEEADKFTRPNSVRTTMSSEEADKFTRPNSVRTTVSSEEKRVIMEERNIAEEEHVDAIKSSKVAEERIEKLQARKSEAAKTGKVYDIRAISEEIEVATKAKEVADELVNVIKKRRETIEKKLADIPVSEVEERKLAIQERNIAQEKLVIADELKSIVEKRGAPSSEIKQVLQEKSDAIKARIEAEDRIARVEDRIARVEERKRIVIDDSIKLPENELEDATRVLPKTSCGMEVEKIKRQMEDQLIELKEQLKARTAIPASSAKIANRYFESLMNDLADKGILDAGEIDNIQAKLRSKLLSMDEVIASLETLKQEGKSKVRVQEGKVKNDREYSELPSDFYTPLGQQVPNEWASEYTILNTNKWQVPMPRPPVCINTQPCKVCPSDSSNYPVNLKQWDDSRYVTGGRINKKWAEDQISS